MGALINWCFLVISNRVFIPFTWTCRARSHGQGQRSSWNTDYNLKQGWISRNLVMSFPAAAWLRVGIAPHQPPRARVQESGDSDLLSAAASGILLWSAAVLGLRMWRGEDPSPTPRIHWTLTSQSRRRPLRPFSIVDTVLIVSEMCKR